MDVTPPKAVLFDLDGTLLDTAGDLVAAVNRLLLRYHRSPMPLDELRSYVSQGAHKLVCVAFDLDAESDRAYALKEEFIGIYSANLSLHSRLFAGMEDCLRKLEQRRIPWGIVTNKPESLTLLLLEELDLLRRAGCIVGADTAAEAKPSAAPVLHACKQLNVLPADAVMVGDDKRDVDAGVAAGTSTIAAGWGYIQADDDPALWQADYCLASVAQLDAWFR